jgi:hypothetical protein
MSDLFIEGRLRGRVLPIIGRGGRYLRVARTGDRIRLWAGLRLALRVQETLEL